MFKLYNQNQDYLLPPSWDDKISKNHPVRIVNNIIDSLDLSELYASYDSKGASSYDPKMLLKAIVFAYVNNVYSSRKIENEIKSNIYYIWLCGNSEPDHNTINRFRGVRLSSYLKDIFKQIVFLLIDQKLLSIKDIYIDGTKIEANANRYSFVWGKSIATRKKKMIEQIDALWEYTQKVVAKELSDTEKLDFKTISPNKVAETVKKIEEALKDKKIPKDIKKKIYKVKKEYPKKLEEYEQQEQILGNRNSYSKTDPDATFMTMKEDRLKNRELKPGYNIQISTNNQIIVNYDLYPNPADSLTLPSHLESYKSLYSSTPDSVTTDAGYGSEENYEYLSKNNIDYFVKYNYFHQEQTGQRQKKAPFVADYLYYNQKEDYYVCPMGQKMLNIGIFEKQNDSGYKQTITRYQARNCTGCPLRGECHKSEHNRIIEVNHRYIELKEKARANLLSEEGRKKSKRRSVDVETVFGNIKQNKSFRRFKLKGMKKVSTEFGLIVIAHNLTKASA